MQVENTNIRGSKWPKDTKGCFWERLSSYGHSQSQQTKISQLISTTNINKPPSPSSLSQETTISLLCLFFLRNSTYFFTVCYQWVRSAPCKTVSHLSRTMLGSDGRALELRFQRFCMVLWCSCVLWWFCCFATLCLQSALEWLCPCCCCGCKRSSCLAFKLKYHI